MTYLQLLFVSLGNGEYFRDVILEPEILECFLHMFTSNSLLGLLLADFVCLGGDQSDKFNTAFHEKVARILGECLA